MNPDLPTLAALPPVTASVTLPPLPIDFTASTMLALIRDIATERYAVGDALRIYKLSKQQFVAMANTPYFQEVLKRFTEDWNRPSKTLDRVATQSAWSVEMLLPTLAARAMNPHEALSSVTEAIKVLAAFANIGVKNATPAPASEKFVINIDLGGDGQTFQTSRPLIDIQPDIGATVQAVGEGSNHPAPVRAINEGAGALPALWDLPPGPPKTRSL